MHPSGIGRISTPVARHLRRRSSVPADLATYLLVQAIQQLALVLGDDAYDALPGLAIPLHPGSQLPWLLAVAVTAHALAALHRGGGYVVPGLIIPVEYRWQNSGFGRRVHAPPNSYIGDLVSHANDTALVRGPLESRCPDQTVMRPSSREALLFEHFRYQCAIACSQSYWQSGLALRSARTRFHASSHGSSSDNQAGS